MWANSSKNNKCRELAKVTTAVTIVIVVTLFELIMFAANLIRIKIYTDILSNSDRSK